jgi:hypothetical protein
MLYHGTKTSDILTFSYKRPNKSEEAVLFTVESTTNSKQNDRITELDNII